MDMRKFLARQKKFERIAEKHRNHKERLMLRLVHGAKRADVNKARTAHRSWVKALDRAKSHSRRFTRVVKLAA